MGLSRKWHEFALELAASAAARSKDPSTKVGASILRPNKSVASVGFNGFPAHEPDDIRLQNRLTKYPLVVHAEANALNYAEQADLSGHTIGITMPPCSVCADKIIRARMEEVVYTHRSWNELPDRWRTDCIHARNALESAGVSIIVF